MGNVSAASYVASVEKLVDTFATPLRTTLNWAKTTAVNIYREAAIAPYKKYFAEQGFTSCKVTYPNACFTKNTPAQKGSYEEAGYTVGGHEKFKYVPPTPEVNETVAFNVNVATGTISRTECVNSVCDTTPIADPTKPSSSWDVSTARVMYYEDKYFTRMFIH